MFTSCRSRHLEDAPLLYNLVLCTLMANIFAIFFQIGMMTDTIDEMVHCLTIENGAYPSPLNYMGFPKSVCTSVNNVACHGIPDDRPLLDGDIINIDVTVSFNTVIKILCVHYI